MKTYTSNNIRNIAVVGHGGKGKTTLCEAMLYVAGATDRLGKVAEGNTVLDFDAEERRRKSSVSSAMAAIEWDNTKLNIIDAPGLFDFEGGVAEAVRAAEAVLIVTSAGSGVDVGTEKAFNAAEKKGIAKFFAITKTDSDHRNFYKTFEALKEVYGNKLCPTIIPYMEGNITKCYVNLMTGMAFEYDADGHAKKVDVPNDPVIEEMTSAFMEAVATTDEALMDKFFGAEIICLCFGCELARYNLEERHFSYKRVCNGFEADCRKRSFVITWKNYLFSVLGCRRFTCVAECAGYGQIRCIYKLHSISPL